MGKIADAVKHQIRREVLDGSKHKDVAAKYGVHPNTVQRICSVQRTCSGIAEQRPSGARKVGLMAALPQQAIDEVLRLARENGKTQAQIAKAVGFGLKQVHVSTIMRANGICRQQKRPRDAWTKDDDDALRSGFRDGMRYSEIAEALGKTIGQVAGRVDRMRIRGFDLPARHRNGNKAKGGAKSKPMPNLPSPAAAQPKAKPVQAEIPTGQPADGAALMAAMLKLLPVAKEFVATVEQGKLDAAKVAYGKLVAKA